LDLYATLVEIRRSTVKMDDYMVKQSLLHSATAFLTEPANLGIEAPSSEGKTYPVVETVKLLPPDCVWFLAGLSPTALAHDFGELVDAETKEPLKPKLMELQNKLEELRGTKDKEARQRRRELQSEIQKLMAKAAYLVDLENKILLFLDRPNPETLQRLYPILSHDVWEASYRYTDRKSKGPLRTVHVILRGWPVAVFIRTRGEGEGDAWQQTVSRFTIISPRMGSEKYRKAIKLRAMMRGLPAPTLFEVLGLDKESWARQALEMVRKRLTEIKMRVRDATGNQKANMFWIPFYAKIGEGFPADMGRRMRDSDRFLALMQAHAALNVFSRPRLVYPNGTEYIICTRDDFKEVAGLYFSDEEKAIILTGLPRHILEFFEKVLLTKWKAKTGGEKLTVSELVEAVPKALGKTLSDNTIRKLYLPPLENAGFVSLEPDPDDKRRYIVQVLKESPINTNQEKTGENVIFSKSLNFSLQELKEAWNELIQIRDSGSDSKNDFSSSLSPRNPRIEDYDGKELTIEDLYEKYFILEQESESRIQKSENLAPSGESEEKKMESGENHVISHNFLRVVGEAKGGSCEICNERPAELIVEIEGMGRRYACMKCVEEAKKEDEKTMVPAKEEAKGGEEKEHKMLSDNKLTDYIKKIPIPKPEPKNEKSDISRTCGDCLHFGTQRCLREHPELIQLGAHYASDCQGFTPRMPEEAKDEGEGEGEGGEGGEGGGG
jgi:hypothetical protein